MKITVTKKEIKRGEPKDCYFCPIALALRKLLGEYNSIKVKVDKNSLELGYNCYRLPLKAQTFITRFDKGKSVKPFSFILKVKK